MSIILPSFAGIAKPSGGGAASFSNGYSLSTDGVDDYLDLGSTNFISRTSAFSVSAWFKLDSWANNYPGICVLKTGNTAGFVIALSNTSVYKGVWIGEVASAPGFKGFSTNNATLSTAITSGWHHLVLTFDGVDPQASSSTTLYIDGTEYAITYAVGIGTNQNVNQVGTTGTYELDGLIDEFAIFNTELSASNVTAIYNSGVPASLTSYSPLAWYRMGDNDSGTGTTVTDQGSGGNDGTLTNGAAFSTTVPS